MENIIIFTNHRWSKLDKDTVEKTNSEYLGNVQKQDKFFTNFNDNFQIAPLRVFSFFLI